MIGGAFWVVVKQNVQEEKVVGVEKRVDKIDQKVDRLSSDVGIIGRSLDIFKVELGKDLEYIKERITGKK